MFSVAECFKVSIMLPFALNKNHNHRDVTMIKRDLRLTVVKVKDGSISRKGMVLANPYAHLFHYLKWQYYGMTNGI